MANVGGDLHLVIRDERIKQGLSQKKLGELVDLPQQAINRIEQGNRKMDVDLFLKFCEILKITKIGNFSIKMISSFYEMDDDEQNRTIKIDTDIDTSHPFYLLQEKLKRGEGLTDEEEKQYLFYLHEAEVAFSESLQRLGTAIKTYYELLNENGQEKADEEIARTIKQIEMLTKIPEYQKEDKSED